MNVYHCRQQHRGFIPWKTEANCRLHWQHFVPWRYPVLQAFPVKLLAPAKCYIWRFSSPWGSHTVNSYGFGVYSEIELFCVAASYPQVSLKTRFLAKFQKLNTPKLSIGAVVMTSILAWIKGHLQQASQAMKQGSEKIHPKVLSHIFELISSLSSMVLFPSKPLLSSWATENQSTAWQSRQLSPLMLGPIAAIARCLSGYQGISSQICKVFLSCKWSGPGRVFWGIWSCVVFSKPTWRLWVVETGDDYGASFPLGKLFIVHSVCPHPIWRDHGGLVTGNSWRFFGDLKFFEIRGKFWEQFLMTYEY